MIKQYDIITIKKGYLLLVKMPTKFNFENMECNTKLDIIKVMIDHAYHETCMYYIAYKHPCTALPVTNF